ncbi:deoxyribonuclease-1-like 2 isoform 3-T3 [Synchiropus picturatus]
MLLNPSSIDSPRKSESLSIPDSSPSAPSSTSPIPLLSKHSIPPSLSVTHSSSSSSSASQWSLQASSSPPSCPPSASRSEGPVATPSLNNERFKRSRSREAMMPPVANNRSSKMRWNSSLPLSHICFLLVGLGGVLKATGFKICAYNVEKFDKAKLANYRAVHTLTKVAARCNIILLQEVIDPDSAVVNKLLASINREKHRYEGHTYKAVSSKELGKSPSDMQKYVFIYRDDTAKVMGQYQVQDKQSFAREPFVVEFESPKTAIKKFVLVPLHTDPDRAVQEMDKLYDVFQDVVKKWNNKNVMFLGDFHASCAHMTKKDKKKIRLFTNTTFHWLIKDKLDTTVSEDTTCAYDRVVVYGTTFLKSIKPYSANVFDVGKTFKIARSQVEQLSGHHPIEVTLKNHGLLLRLTSPLLLLSFVVVVRSLVASL